MPKEYETGLNKLRSATAAAARRAEEQRLTEETRQVKILGQIRIIEEDDQLMTDLAHPAIKNLLDDLGVYDTRPLKGILVLSTDSSTVAITKNGIRLLIKDSKRPENIDAIVNLLLLRDVKVGEKIRVNGQTFSNPFDQGQILGNISPEDFQAAVSNATANIAAKIQTSLGSTE